MDPRAAEAVYFDGECPVCRAEIGWYKKMRGGETVRWIDVAAARHVPDGLPRDTTLDDLMRRFTITRVDGETVSGGPGFIALWRALGPTRWLGRACDHALGRWLGERAYRLFLRIRTLWRPAR